MNFTEHETSKDGNCSFSAIFRALHKHKKRSNEKYFLDASRFMFAYMTYLKHRQRTHSVFKQFLVNSYFLGEDEIAYFALFCLNKFLLLFRNLKEKNSLFVQPQYYDIFLAHTMIDDIICLKCENSHYKYMSVDDGSTVFCLANLSRAFQAKFLPFTDINAIPDVSKHLLLPVCIQTTSKFETFLRQENCLHQQIKSRLHTDLLHGCRAFELKYINYDEYDSLQQLVSASYNMYPIRSPILVFLENADTNQYAIIIGRYSAVASPNWYNLKNIMYILRHEIFIASMADKLIPYSAIKAIEIVDNTIIIQHEFTTKDESCTNFIHARQQLLINISSKKKFMEHLKFLPKFQYVINFLRDRNPAHLPESIRECIKNSDNDLQLLEEIYLRY